MFKLSKREFYINPRTTLTRVEVEKMLLAGAGSVQFKTEAKELQNYNLEEYDGDGVGTDNWLE